MPIWRYFRIRYVVAAAVSLVVVGGIVTAWQARGGPEEEIALAATFLGVPARDLQLVAPRSETQGAPAPRETQPEPGTRQGRAFVVLCTAETPGSKSERIRFVASDSLDVVTDAIWFDGMSARTAPGADRRAQAEVEPTALGFVQHHGPLPGTTARIVKVHPMPVDAPEVYMFECELLGGDGLPHGKALVTVSASLGRVVMYGYRPVDPKRFAKVAVSREKAVATAMELVRTRYPSAEVTLHDAELSDNSLHTEQGRPVWFVNVLAAFPRDPGVMDEHCSFTVDAISGKVVYSGLPPTP